MAVSLRQQRTRSPSRSAGVSRAPLLANFRRLVALQFTAAAAFTAFIVLQFLTK